MSLVGRAKISSRAIGAIRVFLPKHGGMYNPRCCDTSSEGKVGPNRLRRFLRENGIYILGVAAFGHLVQLIRSYFLSRKLGVRKIKIGPRAFLRGLSSIEMGEDFSAGEGLWLEAITRFNDQIFSPKIIVGQHVRISHHVHIAATHLVEIGDNVLMGSKVMITDHNHGMYSHGLHSSPHTAPALRPLDSDQRTLIGRDVWLGDGVVVTPGATIGEGCVIGANSVVLGDIPPFTIAVGVPARVRKAFNFESGRWCNVE
jgi:lipopolysaccharide O-acetyltransferase